MFFDKFKRVIIPPNQEHQTLNIKFQGLGLSNILFTQLVPLDMRNHKV